MQMTNEEILLDPKIADAVQDLGSYADSRLASILTDAPRIAADLLANPDDSSEALLVYRGVGSVMAEAIRRHNSNLFREGIDGLRAIWELGDRAAMYPLKTPDFEASLWENL